MSTVCLCSPSQSAFPLEHDKLHAYSPHTSNGLFLGKFSKAKLEIVGGQVQRDGVGGKPNYPSAKSRIQRPSILFSAHNNLAVSVSKFHIHLSKSKHKLICTIKYNPSLNLFDNFY